ncbi:MAG TPA: 3-phosphoserine/phosphohydroxythreonine transaminase [Pyrinomonadaceae bacterium]|jgi:phosphoserine aminotransferase|nr:3-phosphoserine/phosphohydroxythreonine transaminase [Pyrinomonadaceae bacterium]
MQVKTSSERIFNFSSGPAMLPLPVLEQARDELLSINGSGMSVMEISHRSKIFDKILDDARRGIKDILSVPDNYQILFLQGGASLQFNMVPMNFLPAGSSADFVITGIWGKKAAAEARRCGNVNTVYDSEADSFTTIPKQEELKFDREARYIHYVSNETIDGVEFSYDLDGGIMPVVCDASSNILSKPIDISKYSMIYAGAQKNIGPAGVTLVIISDEMLERVPAGQHKMLDYRYHAENGSRGNTPNTFGIYIIDLVCGWLKEKGGLAAMQHENEAKAKLLYDALDKSDGYYRGRAERDARSLMNVTFNLPAAELEEKFCEEALAQGLDGLRGHRSVGGIRASIYNAFPKEGVEKLVDFMNDFAGRNG